MTLLRLHFLSGYFFFSIEVCIKDNARVLLSERLSAPPQVILPDLEDQLYEQDVRENAFSLKALLLRFRFLTEIIAITNQVI